MSTRLEYSVDSLRESIEAKFAGRVDWAQQQHSELLDLEQKRDVWRADAEERILKMAERIKGDRVGLEPPRDNELESFGVVACPRIDRRFGTPEKKRDEQIEKARISRDNAIRRLEAVTVGEDGLLSLTPTMLRDWFDL